MKLKYSKIKEENINLNNAKRLKKQEKKIMKNFLNFFYFILIVLFAFFSYDSPQRKENKINFINKDTISQIFNNDFEGRKFNQDFFEDFLNSFNKGNLTEEVDNNPYVFITPIRFSFVSFYYILLG
jgi:hypothetical protein